MRIVFKVRPAQVGSTRAAVPRPRRKYMGHDVGNDKLLLIKIEGMHCHKCEQAIRKALTAQDGVHEVEVDFPSKQASVLFDASAVTIKELTKAVTAAGYKVSGFTQNQADTASHT